MRLKILLVLPIIISGLKLEAQTETSSSKKILMIIAHKNFRDEELLVPKEYFENEGWEVVVASTDTTEAHGMLGERVKPDILIEEIDPFSYDALILVGGVGSKIYWNDERIHEIFQKVYEEGKIIGAICIAPVTLAKAGILKEKKATCWSSVSNELKKSGATYQNEEVVVDGNVVTAYGPKASLSFAQKIASLLKTIKKDEENSSKK